MKNICTYVFLILLFTTSNVFGARGSGQNGFFFGNLSVTGGYGNITAANETSNTSVGLTTINANYGFRIAKKFLVGATSGYSFITQFSAIDQNIGNRRGGYLNLITPMIGLSLPKIFFQGVYHLNGSYDLTNKTYSGQNISYVSPSGFRLEFGINWNKKLKPLIFFEQISFIKKLVEGQESLTHVPLKIQQYGLGVALLL